MAIILDHQLREQLDHISPAFPITYFHDEIIELPDQGGPVHWHPEFEIVTAKTGVLDYQVGEEHILLRAGDSIFVNANMLHGIRQVSGEIADPMPGIVFQGTLLAPENSVIYQKYIQPVAVCDSLPYIVFREGEHEPVHHAVQHIYRLMEKQEFLCEIEILGELISIFTIINRHLDKWPHVEVSRVRLNAQIRVQKMLSFICGHYSEPITLADISSAANISRSEAGRCFAAYLQSAPIEFLIRYRLQKARALLSDDTKNLKEISQACGFHSTGYFIRQFRRCYGHTPGEERSLGKSYNTAGGSFPSPDLPV